MNREDFNKLICKPSSLSKTQEKDLKEICEEYPYFGLSQLLLSGLYFINDHFQFEASLRKTAILISDRQQLKLFMNGLKTEEEPKVPMPAPSADKVAITEPTVPTEPTIPTQKTHDDPPLAVAPPIAKTTASAEEIKSEPEIRSVSTQIQIQHTTIKPESPINPPIPTKIEVDLEDHSAKDDAPTINQQDTIAPAKTTEPLHPAEPKLKPKHSNSGRLNKRPGSGMQSYERKKSKEELLAIINKRLEQIKKEKSEGKAIPSSSKPFSVESLAEQNSEISPKSKAPLNKKLSIIDRFIEQDPSIRRKNESFYESDKQIEKSLEFSNALISETLANIILQQGHKQKALEMYGKLILKNPEKSAYFAALIEKIKNS